MNKETSATGAELVVLVTGGAGFLGRALIEELRGERSPLPGPVSVRVLDLELSRLPEGVVGFRGDIRDERVLARAAEGVDVVFHLAAMIDWGQKPPELVREVNVEGTRRVLEAARGAGARGCVFVSSLDAIFGGESIHMADEGWPYPASYPCEYGASKAEAERLTLAANGPELRTIVVRPCSIWGDDDPFHVEPMAKQAVLGLLPRIGEGAPPSQWTHVANVAHAVALAGRAVLDGVDDACGEVYFVTDYPPRHMFDQLAPILREAGVRVVPITLPRWALAPAARLSCAAARLLRPVVAFEPTLTPAALAHLSEEFTVSSDKAERLLGYRPVLSEREAYDRTIAHVRRACIGRRRR